MAIRDDLISSSDRLRRHPGEAKKLAKLLMQYVAADEADRRHLVDRMFRAGGRPWLRIAATLTDDYSLLSGLSVASTRERARQARLELSSTDAARRQWAREHPRIQACEVPAVPGEKPAWKKDHAGIAPPKAVKKTVLAEGMAANRRMTGRSTIAAEPWSVQAAQIDKLRSQLAADPTAESNAQRRAQKSFDREQAPIATQAPSEHSKDFPAYYARGVMAGRIPMPDETSSNHQLVRRWLVAEIGAALNPRNSRKPETYVPPRLIDRLAAIGRKDVAHEIDAATVKRTAAQKIEKGETPKPKRR